MLRKQYTKGAKRLAATVPFFLPGFAQRFGRWCFCVDLLQHLPVLCQKIIRRQGHKTAFGGGECSRFFVDLLQHLHVLCQTRASNDKDTLQPVGGTPVIFFWTISAANPDRTMRSARPPLFVTLFDTLLGRFWRFLGSFWRPERLWGDAGSDERNEARLHGSTNGSGGADGGSDGARPGSAAAPFGRIVEPMAPSRMPGETVKSAPAQAGAHLNLSRWV